MALTRMFENMAGSDQHLKWKVEARPRLSDQNLNFKREAENPSILAKTVPPPTNISAENSATWKIYGQTFNLSVRRSILEVRARSNSIDARLD